MKKKQFKKMFGKMLNKEVSILFSVLSDSYSANCKPKKDKALPTASERAVVAATVESTLDERVPTRTYLDVVNRVAEGGGPIDEIGLMTALCSKNKSNFSDLFEEPDHTVEGVSLRTLATNAFVSMLPDNEDEVLVERIRKMIEAVSKTATHQAYLDKCIIEAIVARYWEKQQVPPKSERATCSFDTSSLEGEGYIWLNAGEMPCKVTKPQMYFINGTWYCEGGNFLPGDPQSTFKKKAPSDWFIPHDQYAEISGAAVVISPLSFDGTNKNLDKHNVIHRLGGYIDDKPSMHVMSSILYKPNDPNIDDLNVIQPFGCKELPFHVTPSQVCVSGDGRDVYIIGKSEDNCDDLAGFVVVYKSTFNPNGTLSSWKFFSHAANKDDVNVDSLGIFEVHGSLYVSEVVEDGKAQYSLSRIDMRAQNKGRATLITHPPCLLQEGLAPVQFLYDQSNYVFMLASDSKSADPRQLKLYGATIGEDGFYGCDWELIRPLPTVCDLGRMTIVNDELIMHSLQQEGVAVDGMFKLKVLI